MLQSWQLLKLRESSSSRRPELFRVLNAANSVRLRKTGLTFTFVAALLSVGNVSHAGQLFVMCVSNFDPTSLRDKYTAFEVDSQRFAAAKAEWQAKYGGTCQQGSPELLQMTRTQRPHSDEIRWNPFEGGQGQDNSRGGDAKQLHHFPQITAEVGPWQHYRMFCANRSFAPDTSNYATCTSDAEEIERAGQSSPNSSVVRPGTTRPGSTASSASSSPAKPHAQASGSSGKPVNRRGEPCLEVEPLEKGRSSALRSSADDCDATGYCWEWVYRYRVTNSSTCPAPIDVYWRWTEHILKNESMETVSPGSSKKITCEHKTDRCSGKLETRAVWHKR